MQQQIDGGGGRRVEAARWWRRQHSGGWFTVAFHYIKTFLNNKTAVSRGEDIHKRRQTGQWTVFDHASCLCAETWWRRTRCLLRHHPSTCSFYKHTDTNLLLLPPRPTQRLSLFKARIWKRPVHWCLKRPKETFKFSSFCMTFLFLTLSVFSVRFRRRWRREITR